MPVLKIGTKVDKYLKLKNELADEKREFEKSFKVKKEKLDALESELMEEMKKEKLEKVAGKTGSVSLNTLIVGTVKNWQEVYKYIKKNNAFFLLNKALNNASYREILESGKEIKGIEKFEKISLSISNKRL